jgi:plasmid stabilization system protein ParE
MAEVRWSRQAADDLEAICEYIARDSEEYARAFAERIVEVTKAIPLHPRSGRVVPEFGRPEIREKIVGNYRIIYRLHRDAVEIVTIIHGARLLPEERPPDG